MEQYSSNVTLGKEVFLYALTLVTLAFVLFKQSGTAHGVSAAYRCGGAIFCHEADFQL
ncbi:hypothetical protein MH117_24995 [Paenibacillus sp. ACRRX]|uniref:hypothetical protein n=1 Tax=Paenibacillus sp. ACRRX TaxID=2918206 RepID=UPI001EF5326C|nr:hypothetical protein [Paenibacillus sp. ACRRX]MCG7410658.1 hypothetical protein [Paenibacillus sp. ACRRX]